MIPPTDPSADADSAARALPNPSPGERVLIEAMRRWAAHRMAGIRPHHAVRCLLSWKASERTAAIFTAWMEEVEASRQRPIHMQCAQCGGLSEDEQRLVVAVGVAPLNLSLAERVTAHLVHQPEQLAVLCRALNAALAAAALPIPARICAHAAAAAGPPSPPTVH
jgi:hypothetical protein